MLRLPRRPVGEVLRHSITLRARTRTAAGGVCWGGHPRGVPVRLAIGWILLLGGTDAGGSWVLTQPTGVPGEEARFSVWRSSARLTLIRPSGTFLGRRKRMAVGASEEAKELFRLTDLNLLFLCAAGALAGDGPDQSEGHQDAGTQAEGGGVPGEAVLAGQGAGFGLSSRVCCCCREASFSAKVRRWVSMSWPRSVLSSSARARAEASSESRVLRSFWSWAARALRRILSVSMALS